MESCDDHEVSDNTPITSDHRYRISMIKTFSSILLYLAFTDAYVSVSRHLFAENLICTLDSFCTEFDTGRYLRAKKLNQSETMHKKNSVKLRPDYVISTVYSQTSLAEGGGGRGGAGGGD